VAHLVEHLVVGIDAVGQYEVKEEPNNLDQYVENRVGIVA
jgi:hypothetical protein